MHVPYPNDLRKMFVTRGFMMTLHVPPSFAKDKNRLSRALYRAGKMLMSGNDGTLLIR